MRLDVSRPEVNARLSYLVEPVTDASGTAASSAPSGSAGTYGATFALTPGEPPYLVDIDLEAALTSGTSLIALRPGTSLRYDLSDGEGQHGIVMLHTNDAGLLSRAEMRVHADSFDSAQSEAFDLVLPVLSRLSFEHDTAISVGAFAIVEESTLVRRTSVLALGRIVPFHADERGVSLQEHRALLSAYREGLTSASPLYQIICFFRVIEGVRKVRSTRRQNAATAGVAFDDPEDRIPDAGSLPESIAISEFRHAIAPHFGRKFGAVVDEHRDVLRNAIAHLDPESTHVVADKHADIAACEKALPVMRYIAREMLESELGAATRASPSAQPQFSQTTVDP